MYIWNMRCVTAILVIMLVFSGQHVWGQYDLDSLVMPKAVNSIGLNLTPFGVILLGGRSDRYRVGLSYKRQVDVSKKLRARGQFERLRHVENELTEIPWDWSDSTIVFQHFTYNDYQYDLRFGLEFFKPNRTTTMVYGADVIIGYAVDYEGGNLNAFKIGNESCDSCYFPDPDIPDQEWETQLDYAVLGLDFSVGQMLRIDDQWSITLFWSPELLYRIPVKEYYSSAALREKAPDSEFIMRLRGIELWLNFEF